MKLLFDRIKIENFLSFENETVELKNLGYTLIKGSNKNVEDKASSNGSGKSSIFEALIWCLTGETIRGSKDVCNSYIDNGCKVELSFSCDQDSYKIVRSKDYDSKGSSLFILKNGNDISGKGIRDTEKILESCIPDLNASLIGSVIILGQGLPQRFSNNTPSGRKEILETLSKSDFMIEDIKNRISKRKVELGNKASEIHDTIISITSTKKTKKEDLDRCINDLDNLENIDEIEKEIEVESKKLNDLKSNQLELEQLRNELNITIDNLYNSSIEVSKVLDKFTKDLDSEYLPLISNQEKLLIEKQSDLKIVNSQIKSIESISTICPTCGQTLKGVEKPDPTPLKEEKKIIENQIEEIINNKNEFEDAYKKRKDSFVNNYSNQIDSMTISIQDNKTKKEKVETDIKNLAFDISVLENKINGLLQYKNNYETRKKELNDRIDRYEKEIEEINEKILYYNNDEENLNRHIEVVNNMNTYVNRDFRTYLLTNVVSYINNRVKIYSKELFDCENVDFFIDGNNIRIQYKGREYENLSGGERQKVDLIIQFSIRDMLCTYLDFSCNCLAIDELFDNLDDIGCEKVLNLLSCKLNDVENIFIITHHSSIPIPFDSIIQVEKGENNISHIVR